MVRFEIVSIAFVASFFAWFPVARGDALSGHGNGSSPSSSSSPPLDRDLAECIRRGECGILSVCAYSFSYEDPCATYAKGGNSNADCKYGGSPSPYSSSSGTRPSSSKERTIEGSVYLIRNGMGKSLPLTWNILGYDPSREDVAERKYVLTPGSFAYFDSGISVSHSVRLYYSNAGGSTAGTDAQVIAVKESPQDRCSIENACEYMLKVCESSFVHLSSSSPESKIRCTEYARACNHFVYPPDLAPAKPPTTPDDGGDESPLPPPPFGRRPPSPPTPQQETDMDRARRLASRCSVDCISNYYPADAIPWRDRERLDVVVDTLQILRRIYLGLTLYPDSCDENEEEFVDDHREIYLTVKAQRIEDLLTRGESLDSGDTAVVALLGALIYYRWYLPKQRLLEMERDALNDGGIHLVQHETMNSSYNGNAF